MRDDGGRVIVKAALPESGRFAIEYRHSYYRVPARERFEAGSTGFRMVGVESPSEAVLDYYEMAGVKSARALDGARAREPPPLRPPAADRDRHRAAGRSRSRAERYPLYARAPRHLTIEVEDRWP